MLSIKEKLDTCFNEVRKKLSFKPEVALVLGSGLGTYAEDIEIVESLSYKDIKDFPVSTVSGHEGRFICAYIGKVPVIIMQGRVHYYEGYDMTDVVLPIRIMSMLGAKKLILSNAAGGINQSFHPGDFMILTDHISSFVRSPLIGPNIDELGTRFPDMSEIYSKRCVNVIKEVAKKLGIDMKEGVYLQCSGPNYESAAEIRMYKLMGADAVGMSTACEAMAAAHMGMEVAAISCITNYATGLSDRKLDHVEVKEVADKVSSQFKGLVTEVIKNI